MDFRRIFVHIPQKEDSLSYVSLQIHFGFPFAVSGKVFLDTIRKRMCCKYSFKINVSADNVLYILDLFFVTPQNTTGIPLFIF